jgi:hypothetical protein
MDDLDFVMEMLKDELNITTETAQAQAMARRAAQVQGYRNAANRSGFVSPQAARQVQTAVANQAPGSASAQKIPTNTTSAPKPQAPVPQRPAPASATAKPTPAPVAPKPTPTATPPKPATPTSSTTSSQPNNTARKPLMYGSAEYNKAAAQHGPGNIIDRTRSIIQGANNGNSSGFDAARMAPKQQGNIKERISAILNKKSPVEQQRQASIAHYNALTNNGTQSVPAGKMPTTVWKNTGDSKAAAAAGAAQRSQMFNTNPGQGANTGSSSTTTSSSANSTAPTRGGATPKTK